MRRVVFGLLFALALILAPASPRSFFDSDEFPPARAPDKTYFKPESLVALTGAAASPFPGAVPWGALCLLDGQGLAHREALPYPDPVVFLEKCLERYDREVRAYTVTLKKQERIQGKLRSPERIEAVFRESPFSVYFHWLSGADRKADKALYVEGKYDNKLLAVPHGVLGTLAKFAGRRVVERDVNGEDARNSGRYPLSEFGFRIATQRVLTAWKKARADNTLHVEYLGVVRLPEAGDRLCYKVRRRHYAQPEEDGVMELVAYFDVEHWLQVGSILRDAQGQLIAEYFFSNLRLNPPLEDSQFHRSALN
jgi:hypothetical protein